MRIFHYAFIVNADIDRVWRFYTDIGHLHVISPPRMKIQLIKSTHQQLVAGSEVWLTGVLLTRSNWHSKISSLAPYEYVDEMIMGRFRVWKHVHSFRRFGDKTEVVNEVEFELHHGWLGRMFEGFVHSQLEKIFAHRKQATIKALES